MNKTFGDIVAFLIGILNDAVIALSTLAVLLFMWGAFKYVYNTGKVRDRTTMLWSLLALFILFSLWGIIRLGCSTFLDNSNCSTGSAFSGGEYNDYQVIDPQTGRRVQGI